jgi:Ca2+-binding RTX toxin-like protein
LLAITGMALVAITGVALADTFDCFSGRACIGTNGPDTLYGTSSYDNMDARQGNDVLYGHERYDFMSGDAYDARDSSTDGNDRVGGGQSFDEMYGYGGNDRLLGRSGGASSTPRRVRKTRARTSSGARKETTISWQETEPRTP